MLDRLNKLIDILPDDNTAMYITSQVNRYYYTSFYSSSGAVLVTKDKSILFVDFRYFEAASENCKDIEVVCYKKLYDTINEYIKDFDITNLIIEEDDVTVSKLNELSSNLNVIIVTDFKLSEKILDFRMIKSEHEIECITKAQRIAEKSYIELLNYISVGVSEKRLALELEYLMKKHGAEKSAFDIISISGKNTSMPHGVPSDKLLQNGDFITFDFGCVYNGYHSDMTRTLALGYATDKMREVYDIVLNAHLCASKNITSGKTCADVDNAARDYISSKGYGDFFGHTTGHGVGLEIHEKPTVYLTNDTVLKSNTVITNEPGIYIPGEFGVRIEDMYVVKDNGYLDLASIDKELLIL